MKTVRKEEIKKRVEKSKIGYRYINDKRYRVLFCATVSFSINITYAVYNALLGYFSDTNRFIVLGIYYFVLSIMRLVAVLYERKSKKKKELRVMRFSGVMLIELSSILGAMVWFDAKESMATSYHEIVMITIALYTFTKLTLAIINAVKARKVNSPVITTIRNISCADAAASIISLQRSMFVTFSGTPEKDIFIMNLCTGLAAFGFVFVLGIHMVFIKKEKFSKQKEAHE